MNFIDRIIEGNLIEAKEEIFNRLNSIAGTYLKESKRYVAADNYTSILDEVTRNPNIVRMGRIQRIRRRIRRNTKGRIVVQKNRKRSAIKGYRISGTSVKRIPAAERIRKARLLKRSWKTTRKAKLRRTLFKRKLSMQRRKSMGLR